MATVREVMSPDPVTIEPSANLTQAAHAMSVGGVGSVLVLEGGTLVGIFTERDILRALATFATADAARTSSVANGMTPDPVTIGPDASAGEALNLMLFRGFRHLPVVEGDTVLGVVSMRDLAKHLAEA
ncbi:MAG TPA: CBS domain-containing protein [Actinomycetota bacterium]|jgi:CBS domain-containing protein|nr:CBS domain-containing protein [Actinomycetota bacterium]